ncbi:hypothetical protein JR316_0004734 [Psilocybe cubensis]|uniref:Uncharacterized protein n=2 Tax=Psilocybe cubensis TaxID=181762 RepID=A0A8H7XYE6_PSICU|nr:hypothetical protein JR316_0004734 [Psilocybe cubensis]KAH9482634.1 hypothetical protein JR316_0004734 [Psilocybe cubensis]
MSTPAPFSRLQLAAALLEYDNDLDDPTAPYRSAQDSAIFAHLRRNPAARPDLASRKSDLLGVSLPSDSASLAGRESALDTRRSRASKASLDALRNPFAVDNTSEFGEPAEEVEDEGLEVDLASWGLDAFIPKDKSKSSKGKGKQPVPAIVSSRLRRPSTNYDASATLPRRAVVTSKSASLGGNIEDLHVGLQGHQAERRRSFGSPLDLVGMEPPSVPFQRPRVESQTSEKISSPPLVPFPISSARSPSPGAEHSYGESKGGTHGRAYSSMSMNSRMILDEGREDNAVRQRNISNDTLGMVKPQEDNPFAIQNPSHISRFDPKSVIRARSYSNASMGSRMMLENDNVSVMTGDPYSRERPLSTLELLRPKVLVMPSPLQPISSHAGVQPPLNVREGFELSADGPPLPPGARSSRRLSSSMSPLDIEKVPLASNSFTPNPLMDLTLSQKTFRNTLAVPGQSMYPEGVNRLPRATEEGQQAELDPLGKEELVDPPIPTEGPTKTSRPAGKLYGKSLIDDLENRKLQMRSKQRVFTGDQRPSMMARSSTLIDPASLQKRPTNDRTSSYGPPNPQSGLSRHPSSTMKPLLSFEGEDDKPLQPSPTATRLPATRSVFGVDTLWQREMAKLKEMEAREQEEQAARRVKEEEEENRKQKKKEKRKKKDKDVSTVGSPEQLEPIEDAQNIAPPPTLPDIQRATRRVPAKPSDSDISSESDDDEPSIQPKQKEQSWNVDSSDEEDTGPRRTTGTGLRYPKQAHKTIAPRMDDVSDEDLPLAATIHKAEARAMLQTSANEFVESDDEDRPLSHVLLRAKSGTSPVNSHKQLRSLTSPDDEDDNRPLALRASRINLGPSDEDDMPLAFHPEQQRRTQYQMLAQHHQQQQQMMIQAQMQSNIMMNASMMGQTFFPPPMINPMSMMGMQVPLSIPSPPPIQDDAKFGLVDRWRRDVVIEGERP